MQLSHNKNNMSENAWYIVIYMSREKCIDLNVCIINYNQLSQHPYQEVRKRIENQSSKIEEK